MTSLKDLAFVELERELRKESISTAIYARYSSDMQSPSSAEDQIARIRYQATRGLLRTSKYLSERYTFDIRNELIFRDEAVSGKIAGRDGYLHLQQAIRTKQMKLIVVDDLSRLTRSLGNLTQLYDLLRFHGVELVSVCEGISSEAPSAKTFFQLKGFVNELGNDMVALRTKRGQEARVLRGFSAGDVRYGYFSQPTEERTVGGRTVPSHFQISINPEEARVVNIIFDLFLKGMGYSGIAKYLNERKVPGSRRSQLISGKLCNWSPTAVHGILTCPKYVGTWEWGKGSLVNHPETNKKVRKPQPEANWVAHLEGKQIREDLIIVPREKWDLVQSKIAESGRRYRETKDRIGVMNDRKPVSSKSQMLLAGLIFCAECGGVMIQITGRRGGYIGCYTHHRKDPERCSVSRLIQRRKLETKVIDAVKEVLSDSVHLEQATKLLNEMIKRKLRNAPDEIKDLERRKGEAERELENLLKFVMTHGDASSRIREALESREREIRELNQQMKGLEAKKADKLLVTPFALKERYQGLLEALERDPVLANAQLKKLFRGGLKCRPLPSEGRKKCDPTKNQWEIEGTLLVSPDSRFSLLKDGGREIGIVEPLEHAIKLLA